MIRHPGPPTDAHLDEEVLLAFVHGQLGEHLAVHAAEHLDACPACANRALLLDPLQRAFASCDDPQSPEDLIAAILEAARPEPHASASSWADLVLGFGSLAIAAVLVLVGGDPLANAETTRHLLDGLALGARHAAGEPSFLLVTAACLVLAALTLQLGHGQRLRSLT